MLSIILVIFHKEDIESERKYSKVQTSRETLEDTHTRPHTHARIGQLRTGFSDRSP